MNNIICLNENSNVDTLQNRGLEQPPPNTCISAVVAPYHLSRWTKVRWVLGYLYN